MARNICSVEGCGKFVVGRGYCSTHYARVKRRGRIELIRAENGAPEKFLFDHVKFEGSDCLIWPFGMGTFGYGRINFRGRPDGAHRVMCLIAHGPPPFPGADAAHECKNRRCVSPAHLKWATRLENMHDKFRDDTNIVGEDHSQAKLNPDSVRYIRQNMDVRDADLAAKLGVTRNAIRKVKLFKTWKHVT